jgi:CoA:oxalate CoA-transferase
VWNTAREPRRFYCHNMILENVRILDLTQYLSGPSATRMLSELGAEVIKVELGPNGDPSRLLPFVEGNTRSYYTQQNRGKNSICVDFSKKEGHDLVRSMALESDIVVENFGPGVLERKGLAWDDLHALDDSLIMASISAFGKEGPLSHLQGFDLMGQALSGMMHLTGEADGPPQFTGSPIADCAAGLVLFGAIGHALFHKERTGRGQYIEVNLVDPVFHMHSIAVQGHSATKGAWAQARSGRQFGIVVPSGTYKGPDGWIVIQVLERQWPRFCEAMEKIELATDPKFCTGNARIENAEELINIVEIWMQSFASNEAALQWLENHRIPAAPVLSPVEAMNHPHFIEGGMVRNVDDPTFGQLAVTGLPVKFSESSQPDREPLPEFLGQSNRSVLGRILGLSTADIEELEKTGVVMSDE